MRVALNLIPVVGGAYAAAWDYAQQMDQWRIQQVAEEATAYGDKDGLAARLTQDERFVDMLVIAIEAGRRSSWEAKRITMGRVLGQAMADDADIDEHAALMAALAALEAVHFRFLAQAVAAPGGRILHGLREPYRSQLLAQGAIAISGIDGGSLDGGPDQAGGMFVSPTDFG